MKSRIFIGVVCIQIVAIVALFIQIQNKRNSTLGVSINTIDSKTIQKTPSSELKNFYEPKANSIEEIHESWLSDIPTITINKDTLNERFNYDIDKKEEVFRIITIGDSYTYGQNTSTKDNWTELLEDQLNKESICSHIKKYEVINLGVMGYDTAYEVERYAIRGQKYNPDLIVWYITDLYRISDKMLELANSMKLDKESNGKKGLFNEEWRQARFKIIKQYGEEGLVNFQISKLQEFREKLYTNKPLLFMSTWRQIEEKMGKKNIYYSGVKTLLNKEDLLPDGHYNNVGHQKFAQEVLDSLIKNNLIPCSQ